MMKEVSIMMAEGDYVAVVDGYDALSDDVAAEVVNATCQGKTPFTLYCSSWFTDQLFV
jgi:hypothetical protein